jgi:hypothetical protein
MTPQPEPPAGYRLLTDEEKTRPLPGDAMCWRNGGVGWVKVHRSMQYIPIAARSRSYATRAQSPETANGWRPISEAPKDGTDWLLRIDTGSFIYCDIGSWRTLSTGAGFWAVRAIKITPTHFQPLPPTHL